MDETSKGLTASEFIIMLRQFDAKLERNFQRQSESLKQLVAVVAETRQLVDVLEQQQLERNRMAEKAFVKKMIIDNRISSSSGAVLLKNNNIMTDYTSDYKDPNAPSSVFDSAGNEIGNPVGRLQEFTQKRLMQPPVFDFSCTESGDSNHPREFVCTVTLGRFTEKGFARSKKTAKRLAAINMLRQLEILQLEGGDAEGGVNTAEGATEK